MSWDYRIDPGALKDLKNLGHDAVEKIRHFLDTRVKGCADPRAFGKPLSGDLAGYWRYRVADYRLICRLDKGLLIVTVIKADHRKQVYKKK